MVNDEMITGFSLLFVALLGSHPAAQRTVCTRVRRNGCPIEIQLPVNLNILNATALTDYLPSSTVLLYADQITPRLRYITAFFSKALFTNGLELTTGKEKFCNYNGTKINYSAQAMADHELHIGNAGLLFEDGVKAQCITCFDTNGYTAFFETAGSDFSFDVFAAAFYLLSRYEEYLPHHTDAYGRYAHTNSLAFSNHFLHLPLVNIWLSEFKETLRRKFPALAFRRETFTFLPTYDIDIAYAYRNKGWWRNAGSFMRSVLKREWTNARERIAVLTGSRQDPFDAYAWMDALHRRFNIKPYYFFLVARRHRGYDKNIPLSAISLQQLIAARAADSTVGLHPSWQSGDDERLLHQELQLLERLSGKKINHSRQHYIRMTLPLTYRRLLQAGITDDYSMGYGSINGFRASVASSFYWYDLLRDTVTTLVIYPFCCMDANAYYQQQLTCSQALEELMQYYTAIKKVNGLMITIWHNHFLGTAPEFAGWREAYERFLKKVMLGDKKG